ncbi:RICIN domain-containing protein [Streptomyces heilongjiangensis]|nr:RICIN domain-containing protein [Streptomyces heilongjiangensis]MDC2949057.1 RICIN domain-containing protein [Streptomyces heilongjiangensis]
MSLWTSLEPPSATVDPGAGTTVRLKLRNTGDAVDDYRSEPVGDLAPWVTAGPNPYAVRITPTERPDGLCTDLPDHGAKPVSTPVSQFTCDATTAGHRLWWLDRQDGCAHRIRDVAGDDRCLDAAGLGTGGDDANLTRYDCSDTDDQEWLIVRSSKG